MWWRKKQPAAPRPAFDGPIVLAPIGHVRNAVTMPRPHGWEQVDSRIEILPEQHGRLAGIGQYSHVLVVFYMDMAEGAPEKPESIRLRSGNTYGIFATRSQLRPNHLGVSAVPLLAVESAALRVRGLDAIDGTAVLDIKPYLPEYDAYPDAHVPRP